MANKLLLTFMFTLLLGYASAQQPESGAIEPIPPSGSGYKNLEGSIINYEYEGFGGFRLHIFDNTIKWRGVGGNFNDIVNRVVPQISRVAENVYFMSWATGGQGGDNVMVNFDDMTVFAHLGAGDRFRMIHGVVHCRNTDDCIPPDGEVMERQEIMQRLMKNRAGGSRSPMAMLEEQEPSPADIAAQSELNEKTLRYKTPAGEVIIQFRGEETLVSENGSKPVAYKTHATKIAEGVYFISWSGDHGGNHIAFNSRSMRIYDQILPNGERSEAIYSASCFSVDGC